jgi:hypothetical protein
VFVERLARFLLAADRRVEEKPTGIDGDSEVLHSTGNFRLLQKDDTKILLYP